MENKKKDSNGCAIVGIAIGFLALWGITGMLSGHSFIEGIGGSIKALVIFLVIGLVIFGLIKLNN